MVTKEGDEVIFATEDDTSLLPWIQAIYRATGQTLKPQLLNNPLRHHSMLNYRSGVVVVVVVVEWLWSGCGDCG